MFVTVRCYEKVTSLEFSTRLSGLKGLQSTRGFVCSALKRGRLVFCPELQAAFVIGPSVDMWQWGCSCTSERCLLAGCLMRN